MYAAAPLSSTRSPPVCGFVLVGDMQTVCALPSTFMGQTNETGKVRTWDADAARADRFQAMEGPYRLDWTAKYDESGDLAAAVASAELDGVPGVSVEFHLRLVNDEVGLSEVRALASGEGETMPLHSELAVRLRLTEYLRQVEREVKRPSVLMTLPEVWSTAAVKVAKRPGPHGHGERFYAVWAKRYVDAVNDEARALAVYKHLGALHPGNRPETIAQWIMKARDKGLLTETGKGKRGGELTDRGKRLLAGHDEEV